jgi:hypothetical protein
VQGLRRQRYVLRAGEKEFFDARRCRGQYVRSTAGMKEARVQEVWRQQHM